MALKNLRSILKVWQGKQQQYTVRRLLAGLRYTTCLLAGQGANVALAGMQEGLGFSRVIRSFGRRSRRTAARRSRKGKDWYIDTLETRVLLSVVRETWNGSGISVDALTSLAAYQGDQPDYTTTLSSLEFQETSNLGDGSRIQGYVTAPESGNYTFYLSAQDTAQFWLSTNANPANVSDIMQVDAGGDTPMEQYSQQSAPQALLEGHRYYFELLQKHSDLYAGTSNAPVLNSDFEAATSDPWSFSGSATIASDGVNHYVSMAPNDSISQDVYFAQDGDYTIHFDGEQYWWNQHVDVSIDGQLVGEFEPGSNSSFTSYATDPISVTAGHHTISFSADSDGGYGLYLDNVFISDGGSEGGGDTNDSVAVAWSDDNTLSQQVIGGDALAPYAVPGTVVVFDSGFEDPDLGGLDQAGSDDGRLAGNAWTFEGSSGIVNDQSGGNAGHGGNQAAYLDTSSDESNAISQEVYFSGNGTYVLHLNAAQFDDGNPQDFVMSVDGTPVATIAPGSESYSHFDVGSFHETTGYHTISFSAATGEGGDGVYFDDAVIDGTPDSETPQPSTFTMTGDTQVALGQPYHITLQASDSSVDVDHWSIQWGDGTSDNIAPNVDGTPNTAHASHVYDSGHGAMITATAWVESDDGGLIPFAVPPLADPMFGTDQNGILAPAVSDGQIEGAPVTQTVVTSNGTYLLTTSSGDQNVYTLYRMLPDGSLDTHFNVSATGPAQGDVPAALCAVGSGDVAIMFVDSTDSGYHFEIQQFDPQGNQTSVWGADSDSWDNYFLPNVAPTRIFPDAFGGFYLLNGTSDVSIFEVGNNASWSADSPIPCAAAITSDDDTGLVYAYADSGSILINFIGETNRSNIDIPCGLDGV